MKKKDLILYYQNKLYELEYGYWELHTGIWNSISMIDNNNTYKSIAKKLNLKYLNINNL